MYLDVFIRNKLSIKIRVQIPGGTPNIPIYTGGGGGAVAHPKWGVLGTGTTQKKGGLIGTGTTQKRGVLGTGTSRKMGVLGTGTN